MSFRKERIRDLLLGFISDQVRQMRDPRLELVSISSIEVSPDVRFATVYWSLLDSFDEKRVRQAQKAIDGAKGFLRKRIGAELDLRFVPELKFAYDNSAVVGARIDEILDKVGK